MLSKSKIKISEEVKKNVFFYWSKYTEKCMKENKNKKINDYIYDNIQRIEFVDK